MGPFLATMKRVFPERQVVDLPDNDPIFHVVYDLDERYRSPANGSSIPAPPKNARAVRLAGAASMTTRAA
jgi:hypothetical protein